MPTVSLCLIVKNEEAVLARCLESTKGIADEIVVVDTGSTDKTKEIALAQGAKVFDFAWIDDFGAARNFAFAQGTGDYLMWMDADDVLLPEDAQKLRTLLDAMPADADTVMIKYNIAFDEEGNPTFSYYRERILRNCPLARWQGAIHEVITPFGKILHWDAAITHKRKGNADPKRNIKLFERMLERGKVFSPREQYYYARELYYNARYAEGAAAFKKFLDDGQGWVENNIEACSILAQCLAEINEPKEAQRALLRAFEYAAPRAEICCELGRHSFNKEDFSTAAFWYEAALRCRRDETSGGFMQLDCYGYLPHMQLCVCYDRLGRYAEAETENNAAGKIRPQSPAYLQNKEYFALRKAELALDALEKRKNSETT